MPFSSHTPGRTDNNNRGIRARPSCRVRRSRRGASGRPRYPIVKGPPSARGVIISKRRSQTIRSPGRRRDRRRRFGEFARHQDTLSPSDETASTHRMSAPRGLTQVCKQPNDPRAPRRIRSAADRSGDGRKQPLRHLWWRFRHHSGIEQREAGGMQARQIGPECVSRSCSWAARVRPKTRISPRRREFAGGHAVTLPQARPLEGGIEVARIAYEGLSFGFEERQ